jgi:hypothetical protein
MVVGMTKNQCMGCQAGWPCEYLIKWGYYRHSVTGGYPGEGVVCTKNRYKNSDEQETEDKKL